MGGNVAWTIRTADGVEYRMDRWTNVFPEVVSDEFLFGSGPHLEAAVREWQDMRDDWERNKDSGQYALPMTPVYAPFPYGLRPSEYGFIYTDFVTGTLVSCQHYCGFGKERVYPSFLKPELLHEPDYPDYVRQQLQAKPDDMTVEAWGRFLERARAEHLPTDLYGNPAYIAYERLKRLYEAGRIHSVVGPLRGEPLPVTGQSLTDIVGIAVLRNAKKEPPEFNRYLPFGYVRVSPPEGWTLLEFPKDTAKGRRDAYEAVRSTGIALDAGETADFETWIAEQEESDREAERFRLENHDRFPPPPEPSSYVLEAIERFRAAAA